MLDRPTLQRRSLERPDPSTTLIVGLLAVVAVGLLVAAVLAVYDYNVSPLEIPMLVTIGSACGLALLLALSRIVPRPDRPSRRGF